MGGLPVKSNDEIETMMKEIVQVLGPPIPTSVERMATMYRQQWTETAEKCVSRAEELEAAASELRQRAKFLIEAGSYLDDVKTTVQFEIDSRNHAARLALVNPSS